MRSEKPIYAPPRLSEVSPALPLKQFHCKTKISTPPLFKTFFNISFHNFFHVQCLGAWELPRVVLVQRGCTVSLFLAELFSRMRCSTKPEDSFSPLFKAILYSVSWVKKLVNM